MLAMIGSDSRAVKTVEASEVVSANCEYHDDGRSAICSSRDQIAVEVPTRRGGSIDDGEISISRGWGETEMF
jgi:hypothetical protein